MDAARFDRLTRTLSSLASRRGTLAGLLGGLLLPVLPEAATMARKRRGQAVQAEKRRKTCQSGLLTCKIKKGKKKKRYCVDAQTDPLNCGACGNPCASGQTCQGGVCTCNGALCAGCCDGSTCQAGTSTQRCGLNGTICQTCTGGSSCQNGVCTCPTGQTFGGGGTPGVCGCTPTTCAARGKNCSTIPDTCGGTLNCGSCDGGASGNETCGGGGVANVCGCRANGFVFPFEEDTFNCDPCCSGDCCFVSPGLAECAGGCG